MKHPMVAIGLDAADPALLEEWFAAGELPNLQNLCARGAYGRLDNLDYYKAETPWTSFITGRLPAETGYWSPETFRHDEYRTESAGAYDFRAHPPFYALGPDYRVAVFDVPQSVICDDVNGPQVLAWGAHSPQTDSLSKPETLLDEITHRFGPHPALHNDHGEWWDAEYLHDIHRALATGLERRSAICRHLLNQERWDLFLTVFSETHSAGHDFWHISRPDHPLHAHGQGLFDEDPLLDVYRRADRAVGEVLSAAPADAYKVVFSVHGSDHNVTDVPSMVLLPEFLYRYSFPNKAMLAPGKAGSAVPPPRTPVRMQHWQHEMREYRYDPNPLRRRLKSLVPRRLHARLNRAFGGPLAPDLYDIPELKQRGYGVAWQPAQWYAKSWPRMKAFALPSFSEGYIRINLRGREPQGVVAPENFATVCDEVIQELEALVDPRTGEPVVRQALRVRGTPHEQDPSLPDADIIVNWADTPVDVVDHPRLGRIGPVPYRRTGSHRPRGFWMVEGPGIEPGSMLPTGHAVNLPSTLLELMGAPLPEDATPILRQPALFPK